MTALSAAKNIQDYYERRSISIGVASGATIYQGGAVCVNSSGYAVAGSDTAGYLFAGVSNGNPIDGYTNVVSCASNNAKQIEVKRRGVFEFAIAAVAITDFGKPCWLADDQTVQLTKSNVFVGFIVGLVDATTALVEINTGPLKETDVSEKYVYAPVAATTAITANAFVSYNATGYLVLSKTASTPVKFAGVALAAADNSAGSDGDLSVWVQRTGEVTAVGASLSQASVGLPFFADATTANKGVTTSGAQFVGICTKYSAATVLHLDITPATQEPGTNTSRLFVIPFSWYTTVGAVAVTVLQDFEFPRAFRVLRGYAKAQTAPGGAYVCTITFTDGTTPKTVTITGAATTGESEAINTVYAANTDCDITLIDDNASAVTENINGFFIAEAL